MSTPNVEGLVTGHWQIGPRTRTYALRPPAGKGVTHEGRDLRTGASVGVLLLRPPWDRNARVRRDHTHGATLLRSLDHPHIVKVHEVIDQADLFALILEPLPGDNLHRHIQYGANLPTEAEVVQLMLEIAAALEHAHDRGVVFGNVKPTNVEVFPGGPAKVFALPKPPHEFSSFLDAADYLGYPVYCAPEVLRCDPLDARTDVYGLGLCAYEQIVSQLPHRSSGNLGADLRGLVAAEWPAPADVVEGLNPVLNRVVSRCLQKDPAKRYPTVKVLIEDLKRIQARSVRLVSSARLAEIVTTAFPAPIAALARALERDDHLLAQRDKLLNLASGLVTYLGFQAAQGLGAALGREYTRPSLGHWLGLLRRALQGEQGAGWPLEAVRARRGECADLLKGLDEVVQLRNRMAHGAAPDDGPALHEWVGRMTAGVRETYRRLLFLASYSLVVVADLDYQDEGFTVGLRRLDGIGEHDTVAHVRSAQPYTKGRVYLAAADGSRMALLHPWVVYAKCPLCFRPEVFFYASATEQEAHYVSPDRGHSWTCPLPPELSKAFA